jgi:2-oxoglutarate dehydrogenase E2 component (dihydrolipoamide succinyltransferase)
MENEGFTVEDILNGLIRISKEDVAFVAQMKDRKGSFTGKQSEPVRETGRERMSVLRRKLSQRLVAVKNETAMLTTFNEVDMSSIINIRKTYQSRFTEKHGVKLGFMSFFTRAVTGALRLFPNVNSYIDEEDIVTPKYCDIGIAVQTDKGLMVPVIRNTEVLGLSDIEKKILELADKARRNRISIEDMTGGTFTITNGGIFGSLLSTPILNPPQSGILGMHNIVERPVAINGKVEIRPMMYIALSYDHRIIDGSDSVSFLVKVKEILEDPVRLLNDGFEIENRLLDL